MSLNSLLLGQFIQCQTSVLANASDVKNIDAYFIIHKATLLQVEIIQYKIY
jgi:hypothetical protein